MSHPALILIEGGGDKTSRFYSCGICGRRGKWGPEWGWFGSVAQLEGEAPGEIVIICSEGCKQRFEQGGGR